MGTTSDVTIQRETLDRLLEQLAEQTEAIRELRQQNGLHARQIEHLRDRLRSTSDDCGIWIEDWPTA